jgi:hypothetical protein
MGLTPIDEMNERVALTPSIAISVAHPTNQRLFICRAVKNSWRKLRRNFVSGAKTTVERYNGLYSG